MTGEKHEYAKELGLFAMNGVSDAELNDKKMALEYVNHGAPIPRTLMWRIERYRNRDMQTG